MSAGQRPLEWWIAVVRLLVVFPAIGQVVLTSGYPPGYERVAWILTAVLAAGAATLYATLRYAAVRAFQLVAMTFDFLLISAFAVLYTFESATPTRQLLFVAIVAGAARFGMAGGIWTALAAVPVAAYFEDRRAHFFHVGYRLEFVTLQAGAGLLMALLVGWLYNRLDEQRRTAELRADEAEALRDELQRLAELRADFVSLVSHELRSPVASVLGAARTLQHRWHDLQPEARQVLLGLIADEATRLGALIADVFDTSRIEAGTFSYRFAEVDLATLVQDSVTTAAAGQNEIRILAEVEAAVPPVLGDPERLRQVVGNLIENAMKYSPVGEAVQVRVTPVRDAVAVSVSDRGPGIASADQRVIFEKFGRVAGDGAKPGTGLGLYIARSITEAHSGTLEVWSAPGRGSTFTVTLPCS
ncbi:MAG TPA: HAMP domain-containing sensor histidine kinase [Gaiellaceae bacterium]|nr:HAMP domain-containing sensor histidine kinase [Gaiellaceae bacterium]